MIARCMVNGTWKSAWKPLLIIFTVLLLTGCWDRTEVNDLAIITAGGLDRTEDGQLEIQVRQNLSVSPSQELGSMTTDSGGTEGMTIVRSARGVTMAEASSRLQQELSRKVFWGQDEMFVFGRRLAEAGISGPVEFLTRHPIPRERAYVFLSVTTARDVIELHPPVERSISHALRKMAENQNGMVITMKELTEMLAGRSRAGIMPLVETRSGDKNQGEFAVLNGVAVLKDGKLAGTMSEAEAWGIMWLRNEVKRTTLTIAPPGARGLVSLQLRKGKVAMFPHQDEETWSLDIRVETVADVLENTSELNLSIPDHLGKVEREAEEEMERRIRQTLEKAKEMKADIFGFAEVFYRKNPKEWNRRNKDRWDELFSGMEVNVRTEIRIVRPGMTSKSILIPDQR